MANYSVTINFNANGGSQTSPITVESSQQVISVQLPVAPTRQGYTFKGWSGRDGLNQGEQLMSANGSHLFGYGTYTLTAQWERIICTVTFDAGGGIVDGGSSTLTKTISAGAKISNIPMPLWPYHYFYGWFTAETGGDMVSKDTTVWEDATYYAHWAPYKYTVTFEPNGGTFENGEADSVSRKMDYDSSLTAPTVTRTGYTFTSWSPSVPSKVPAKDETYTAQWQVNQYTVEFDANGGTGGQTVTQAYDTVLSAPTVTRTGWTFTGWSPSVPSTMPAENTTYTAQWERKQYTVKFTINANDKAWPFIKNVRWSNGSTGNQEKIVTYGLNYPSGILTPVATGYEFQAWYNKPDNTYIRADIENATVEITGNRTFYAQWKPKNYNVALDANGGTCNVDLYTVEYGQNTNANIAKPSRVGYEFLGWYDAAQGGNAVFNSSGAAVEGAYWGKVSGKGLLWSHDGTVTIYAHWKPIRYDINYDNLFSFYGWGRSESKKLRSGQGAVNVSEDEGKVTITPRGQHNYTNYGSGTSRGGCYSIEVAAQTKYKFSCTLTGKSPTSEVFWVATDANNDIIRDTASREYRGMGRSGVDVKYERTFTTPAGCTRVQIFFDVHNDDNKNTEETFSKIRLRENGIPSAKEFYRSLFDYSDSDETTFGTNKIPKGPTCDGYTFVGWFTAAEGGAQVTASTAVKDHAGNFNAYSHWKRNVKITINVVCEDTANNYIPSEAGAPGVRVGGRDDVQTEEVSHAEQASDAKWKTYKAELYVPETEAVTIYAAKKATGIAFSRFLVRTSEGSSVVAENTKPQENETERYIGFTVEENSPEIAAYVYYSRDVVTATVSLGNASQAKIPNTQNLVAIDPSSVERHFGDTATFVAGTASGFAFYGWGTHVNSPSDPLSTDAAYEVTLTKNTNLYAHYGHVVNVAVETVDEDGNVVSEVGGSVSAEIVYFGEVEGDSMANGFILPLGRRLKITPKPNSGYRRAGIFFTREGSQEAKDANAKNYEVEANANGTYTVRFSNVPKYAYVACTDVAEQDEGGEAVNGTIGTTTLEYYGDEAGAFSLVNASEVPDEDKDGIDEGATWYKVWEGETVRVKTTWSSAANALSLKNLSCRPLSGDEQDIEQIDRGGTVTVSGGMLISTTWGIFENPSVVLSPDDGGRAMFKGEAQSGGSDVHVKAFPVTYDTGGDVVYQSTTVVAVPDDGYVFVGWAREDDGWMIVSNDAEYEIEKVRSDMTLVAKFSRDKNAVFAWEGGESAKTMEWKSGVLTMPSPCDPVAVRVDATGYPVEVDVGTYSSPSEEPTRQHAVEVSGQSARRLQRMRPERFWRASVRASVEVDSMTIATNIVEAN